MKEALFALCALACVAASGAAKWKNLDDKSYVSGPKLAEEDLLGKVVFVYFWDNADEKSVDMLKDVEKTWNSFKAKPFVLVGTYVGTSAEKAKEAVEKNKLTFPVYRNLTPDPPPTRSKTPFFCILDHRGTAVYTNNGLKPATEAASLAITERLGTPSLCKDVAFKKYKPLEKQLVLGKNIASIVKTLTKDVQKAKDPAVASETQEILSAIDSAKDDIKEDIEIMKKVDPSEALKLIQLFMKTWPKDDAVAGYKDEMSELKKAAAEKAKADKAKAKEKPAQAEKPAAEAPAKEK